MKEASPITVNRVDYQPPAWTIDETHLRFELEPERTTVTSKLKVRRCTQGALVLDGDKLQLTSVSVDGTVLTDTQYVLTDESLTIGELPDQCEIAIVTVINPVANKALEGLYRTSGNYCTQCEAEGFRRITYYLDRPDVLSIFYVTIIADKKTNPVLLSNGNKVGEKDLANGLHQVDWHDPFPKPCYLFALVAGSLAFINDQFVTRSGRVVQLYIYVEQHNIDQCDYAMDALKRSMKWDEEVYGLEYDLELFMIVAVDDFNAGAMENKGLNVFNSKYVLANAELATDTDFLGVEAVIAHEYFHNWTGNRVTCRDWFQLSLKEGLTVFRDQEFSSDMQSRAVKRIEDVQLLRNLQFPEDAGPMTHPIRPDSYIEINNFYTLTVYEKGAEIIRMIHTLLGPEAYMDGINLYFERHDGHAVTCDDFVQAMQDASKVDLSQFRRWYSQSGTPKLQVQDSYDFDKQQYSLTIQQTNPKRGEQTPQAPLHIPVRLALLDDAGRAISIINPDNTAQHVCASDNPEECVLSVTQDQQTFVFDAVPTEPVPSLLRNFSAPVIMDYDYSDDELAFLLAHDSDSFNRWEAGQRLGTRIIEQRLTDPQSVIPESFIKAFEPIFADKQLDAGFKSLVLDLPSIETLANNQSRVDVHAIHRARSAVATALATYYESQLLALVTQSTERQQTQNIGVRQLANTALVLLSELPTEKWLDHANQQYQQASNMSDRVAALTVLCDHASAQRDQCLAHFYATWSEHKLVVDKWFSIQAKANHDAVLDEVQALLEHPAFDDLNPNRFRSLVGAFAMGNPLHFHRVDGAGYDLVADHIVRLNKTNPQMAARLLSPFLQWQRFAEPQQVQMQSSLQRIADVSDLSPDVYEIVNRALQT